MLRFVYVVTRVNSGVRVTAKPEATLCLKFYIFAFGFVSYSRYQDHSREKGE